MQRVIEWNRARDCTVFGRAFSELYAGEEASRVRERYCALLATFRKEFPSHNAVALFSAPGRSEIIGNHTDHQHGMVVAAAITLDFAAAAGRVRRNAVTVVSTGYQRFQIGLDSLSPRKDERNNTKAFVRGIAAYLKSRGYTIGGFDVAIHSNVPRGSGLSSSAAYGILIGSIWNGLYNEGRIPFTELALAAQTAENRYFGKPSGLMDQLACAAGGFAAMDFADPAHPVVERIDCDMESLGYAICIVNPGGSHAGLTNEYADIPAEMAQAARFFGKSVLHEVDRTLFEQSVPELRRCGIPDRAILRSMHFFDEITRVEKARDALKAGDMPHFLDLINASGRSSETLLQNVCPQNKRERSVSLALALSQKLLTGCGAWRVHGGGFAGTIQAIVPLDRTAPYIAQMERVFGKGCCYRLRVRAAGSVMLAPDESNA